MAEKHDVKEIEASLKRMLNMPPVEGKLGDKQAPAVKQESEISAMESKPKARDKINEPRNVKSSDEGIRQSDQTMSQHHHQSDPGIVGAEVKDESHQQASQKKKKKKPKKKNKQGNNEEQTGPKRQEPDATGPSEKGRETKQGESKSGPSTGGKMSGPVADGKKKEEKEEESEESDDGRPLTSFLKTATKVKYLDDKLTPATLKEMEKEKIFPLKKKSAKFPHAKYFCRLCEYHCDNIPVCRQHYNEPRHKRKVEIATQDRKLKKLPQPSERHLQCLDRLLSGLFEQYGLSDQDIQERADITSSVQSFLTESIPGLELRVYGSSLTGFGLKSSGLNMDLVVPDGSNPAQLLTKVYRLLSNSDTYKTVKSNFLAKVPSVIFDSPCGTVHCEISVNSDLAYYTSRLLAVYSRTDPRLRQLAVVFRYWAQVCQVDDQQKGSLPAYTFGLMTVFYLQQCKPPVLPVLWKDLSEAVLKRPKTPNDILTMLTNLDLERQEWVCENDHSIGRLWLGLLLYYGVNYSVTDYVISIRQERLLLRSEKKWKTRRMAIEDPFSTKRNVARTLFSTRIFDYVYNCIRKGCLYFSLPTNQQDVSLSSDKSKDKTHHQKSGPNQSRLAHPKPEERKSQVPYSSSPKSKRSNEQSITDPVKSLFKDSSSTCSDRLTHSEEANIANVETVLAANGGSSSDSSIKEHEFFVECKKDDNEMLNETNGSSQIKEHSFLSSGENSSGVNEQEKLEIVSRKDLSELEDGLRKLNIKENNLDNAVGDRSSLAALEKENDCDVGNLEKDIVEGTAEKQSAIVNDICVDKDDKTVTHLNDSDEENVDFKGASEIEFCDNGDKSVEDNQDKDVTQTTTATGAILDAESCNKTADQISDDPDSSEQDNILGVYTQDDSDIKLHKDTENSVDEVLERPDGTNKDIPTHSFLNEEDNDESHCEKDNDVEDIIGHSFLADDSLLGFEQDSSEEQGNNNLQESEKLADDLMARKESKKATDKDDGPVIDTESSSGSESDLELDSPESSPIMKKKKKLERPASPENAEYEYIFTVDSLTDGKGPSIFCSICEKEGHLKGQCPEEQLPEVKELAPASKQHLKLLTNVIKAVPCDFQLTTRELDDREAVRWGLECFIQELFPEAECSLFGSSKNGFGFHFSDLDICVTFRGKNPKELNFVELIEALSKKLKTHKSFYNVFPITTAKVPIVKFIHRPTRLEGDISLYNTLAQQNTRLLYCYSCVDPRVGILGYAIKVFAKVCDIGDASRGSLSSYAYMLLLFHYLQHTKPPVIPVLQELKDTDEVKEFMIDGWNAWFYDDLNNLNKVWPDYRRNKQSVGQLWLGLFKYYVEEFNVAEQVATVRQHESLTKFEKLWNGKCIAIEDPFDLSHNLGAGLTRKMHKYIMSALINARELYGTSVTGAPNGFNALADYFFDRDMLTEGELPNDRLCRVCSKIGHIAKECPRVLARKEREAEDRKRKGEQRKSHEMRDKGGTPNNRGNYQNNPKQQVRSHPGPSRSLSDPMDTSPRRPQGRGQLFINRQFSSGADLQSYDNAQGYNQSPRHPGMNNNPSSPLPIPSRTYNKDRQPQSNSPRSYPQSNQPQSPRGFSQSAQGFSPGGFNNQPFGNIPQWANRNDNSRRNFQQPNQNHGNFPHFATNQNQGYIQPLLSLPVQMPGNQPTNGNRGYSSSPNQNQGYQNRKQQPRNLLTNEDKDLSSSSNRNQAYNRSQQHQQQVFPIDPGFVHGCPLISVPYFPVVTPAPYITHPGDLGGPSPYYYTNQDIGDMSNNNSTENVDTNMENNEKFEKTDSAENIEMADQNLSYMEQQNAGYFLTPWFPGQVIWPVPGYVPQPEESDAVKTESSEMTENLKEDQL